MPEPHDMQNTTRNRPRTRGIMPDSLRRESVLSLDIRIRNLIDEMRACIASNTAINMSTPPHREITEALHALVYEQGETTTLKIKYNDNSLGKPFPIHALWLPSQRLLWKEDQALQVGTLTFRHVDYDDYVDVYLIRDRETRSLSNAGIEELAYLRMNEILSDSRLAGESYLALYQTGLEPLVVGMYRAVVDHLRQRRQAGLGQLVVRPIFFVSGHGRRTASNNLWG